MAPSHTVVPHDESALQGKRKKTTLLFYHIRDLENSSRSGLAHRSPGQGASHIPL